MWRKKKRSIARTVGLFFSGQVRKHPADAALPVLLLNGWDRDGNAATVRYWPIRRAMGRDIDHNL